VFQESLRSFNNWIYVGDIRYSVYVKRKTLRFEPNLNITLNLVTSALFVFVVVAGGQN
jgi:hypothetical protein